MIKHSFEANEISLLAFGTIHDILSIRLSRFQQDHGSLPEIMYMNTNCQMAMIVELIRIQKLPPEKAVIQPIWYRGFGKDIPLLFSPALDYVFIQMINTKLQIIENL